MPKIRKEMIEEVSKHIIGNPAEGWYGFIRDAARKELEKWDDDKLANWYKKRDEVPF